MGFVDLFIVSILISPFFLADSDSKTIAERFELISGTQMYCAHQNKASGTAWSWLWALKQYAQ